MGLPLIRSAFIFPGVNTWAREKSFRHREAVMKKFLISSAIFIVILSAAVMLFARSTDPAHQEKNRIVGDVTAIDSGARRLTIRTDGGKTIILSTDEATRYPRVPPNERSLEKAVAISFPDISVGDIGYGRSRVSHA